MAKAISNTSPLLYLYRAGALDLLPLLLDEIWIPRAVQHELEQGQQRGYAVPGLSDCSWAKIVDPKAVPSEWLGLDLGAGELAAMALALENPDCIVLLDDALARRIARAAGLQVWGTLQVLLTAKQRGLCNQVGPVLQRLVESGMWISDEIKRRVLLLAGEDS